MVEYYIIKIQEEKIYNEENIKQRRQKEKEKNNNTKYRKLTKYQGFFVLFTRDLGKTIKSKSQVSLLQVKKILQE